MHFNSQNKDFPLKLPPYVNLLTSKIQLKKHHHSFDSHSYNNETPNIFRLDILKECKIKYHNPFLDNNNTNNNQSEQQKFICTNTVKHMKVINKLNTNKDLSKNPKFAKLLLNESNLIKHNQPQPLKSIPYSYTITQENEEYNDILRKMNRHYSKKLHFKQKKYINSRSNITLGCSLQIPSLSQKHIEKLTCSVNPSSYLSNWSDYNIGEKDYDANREIIFPRQNSTQYNPIKDQMEETHPSIIKNNHWSSFYENYTILAKQSKGFLKKGGLFTEYTDKNKTVIEYNQFEKKRNKCKKESIYLPPKPTSHVGIKMKLIKKQCFSMAKKVHMNNSVLKSKVNQAKKIIEDKMLYKLKDIYSNVNYNHTYASS